MMNSPTKGVATIRRTTLNPIAAEFIPLALRPASGYANNSDVLKSEGAENRSKAVLDRTDSATSNTSDDDYRQYWRSQLPDDITPDFKFLRENDLQNSEGFVLGSSAAFDYTGMSKSVVKDNMMGKGQGVYTVRQQHSPSNGIDVSCTSNGESSFAVSQHGVGRSFGWNSVLSASNAGEQHALDQQLMKSRDGHFASNECNARFLNELLGEQMLPYDDEMNGVELLATGFPGFAAESLADIYYPNGGDLSSTIEMLTHLQLQDDIGLHHNVSSNVLSSPNLCTMDFPALPTLEMLNGLSGYTGDEVRQSVNMYGTREADELIFGRPNVFDTSRAAPDFDAVRKSASQHPDQWKYEINGAMELSVEPSRNTFVSASSFAGNGKMMNGDRLHSYTATQHAQLWLEAGEAVENMHSDLRLEAWDQAHTQNTYFEQARQAYHVGNKDLLKELGANGPWHHGQMKAAHGRHGEANFSQRNPPITYLQNFVQGQDRLINLHGLHVNEAIHVLKHELNVLRNAARSTCQRQQVLICVGTDHRPKGSHTPAILPFAVEQYLLEGEHLDYTEPQPGVLRVVIC